MSVPNAPREEDLRVVCALNSLEEGGEEAFVQTLHRVMVGKEDPKNVMEEIQAKAVERTKK